MAKPEKLIKFAQEHLNGEEVKYWIFGAFKSEIMGKSTLRNGLFIATDRQVFFYCKKTFGYETESFPFSNISSIEAGKGAMGHKLNIFASGNKAEMSMINTGQYAEFVEYVRSRIGKSSAPAPVETKVDTSEELRKYKALVDDGIISEEDFAEKKKQLLGI
ncbi:PH domain-containing protein [Sporosarcina sp. ACRSL]|uniref:PH domain-containing protein n=1 Tax=Sporosarcina sp. ACRSL TaxID=2918215 RepID=UPI001EF6EA44|nr:PH domain-containing protein [Sporosarcina sp. ACRSL]MCG7346407.1 PH domain-containing protein [Sporosarcina sp. ACRSL]